MVDFLEFFGLDVRPLCPTSYHPRGTSAAADCCQGPLSQPKGTDQLSAEPHVASPLFPPSESSPPHSEPGRAVARKRGSNRCSFLRLTTRMATRSPRLGNGSGPHGTRATDGDRKPLWHNIKPKLPYGATPPLAPGRPFSAGVDTLGLF